MNIHELDSYNLGDAVKFNDRLNPRIWGADEKMRPEVREQLLKIADDFREFLGIDVEVKDITVSGSNAAYTYTPHSDIDLHLVVDLPKADASEVYRELFDAKKYAYNEQHDIKIGGYDVELYVQDANQTHHSQGIYSIVNNDWISVPKRRKPDVDDISVKSKFEDLGHRIEAAIKSGSYERMTDMAKKLKDYRQAGLDAHGEFGPENLAFKILRTQGLIKKLYDARSAAKDQLLSLDERRKKKTKKSKVKYGFGGYWYPGTAYAGQDHPAGAEGGDGGGDGGGESIREDATVTDEQVLKDFVDFCVKELKIKRMPVVKLRRDPQWSVRNKTFGRYIDDQKMLEVAWGNRHIMDVLRTVAHELTHKHQHERETMPASAGETGSEYENEANARAGILMRDYGRLHPELFDQGTAELEESASGYIPTRAQAKDPRYSMALTQDIKPGQVGKEANKLKLKTNKQGQPQIARANGLFETLYKEYKKYKADEDYSADNPPGPEFKPTMPAGTLRVDVSDVYDWYKLGQHISDLEGLGQHDFGQGPPSSIISFGDEDTEHKFIDKIKATGLDVTDIDPKDPKKRPGKTVKTDPTYNVNESDELNEVKMSPSALRKFANSPEAEGIMAGFEAELIFRDTQADEDDAEMEYDMDYDERATSIEEVVEFFMHDDFGNGLSDRGADRLREQLDNAYFEWRDDQVISDFENESEDLVREVWLEERPMSERILSALTDGIGLDDAEADRVLAAGEKAPRFTKNSDQEAYKQENPDYATYLEAADIADEVLDEEVEASISNQDGIYDQALENFQENWEGDDSSFFTDIGLRWMSDIMNEYGLDWPYMTGGGGNGGSREWSDIAGEIQQVTGMPVEVGYGYHTKKRVPNEYVLEPDGSLSPDDSYDFGLELVSPPMPLNKAIEQLEAIIDWANSDGNAYTNSSTGLHMGISIPFKGGDVDYLKLILFMGDKYVLDKFGRAANTYTASALDKLRQNVAGSKNRGDTKIISAMELMRNNLIELAQRYVQQGVGNAKYTSAHIKPGYIEFRSPGGDYLSVGDQGEQDALASTMRRFAYAMYLAGRPDLERPEYYKKLYKLIAPDGGEDLNLFAKFSSGELTAEELKKQWAERVIDKEVPGGVGPKSNWKLYNKFTKQPVVGLEFNNYTEMDALERAKARVSPASSMTDFKQTYELRDVGTNTGRWSIIRQDNNETLEIVDANTRGAAADLAYEKYTNVIPFYVEPYSGGDQEPEPKLSRRAQLAKQIAQPKDYVILDKQSMKPVYTFRASSQSQAVDFAITYLNDKDLNVGNYSVQKASNVKQAIDNRVDSRQLQQRVDPAATDQYEIVDRRNGQIVLRYRADDETDAGDKFNTWLRNQGMPTDTENYGYRAQQSVNETIDGAQKAQNAMDAAARKLGYPNFAALPPGDRNTAMQMASIAPEVDDKHYDMLAQKYKKGKK
jgi:hypothetical protein